jgi:DNA-binding NarL/FixJ family response regulator
MSEPIKAAPVAKIKVLIVDDLAHVREGLRTVLQLMEDIEVAGEASNGLEAVQLAEQLNPDIVVMDLEMPGLDGFEATQQIKDRHLAQGVVVLTIHGHDQARERAASLGADAFVDKGAGFATLVAAIWQVGGQITPERRKNGDCF